MHGSDRPQNGSNVQGICRSFLGRGKAQPSARSATTAAGVASGRSTTGAAFRSGGHRGSEPGGCVRAGAAREPGQNTDSGTKMQQTAILHFRGNLLESLPKGWLRGLDPAGRDYEPNERAENCAGWSPVAFQNPPSVFLGFEVQLLFPRRAVIAMSLGVHQLPRCISRRPSAPAMVVLLQAGLRIFTDANVKAAPHLAPQYVHEIWFARDARHGVPRGRGFGCGGWI